MDKTYTPESLEYDAKIFFLSTSYQWENLRIKLIDLIAEILDSIYNFPFIGVFIPASVPYNLFEYVHQAEYNEAKRLHTDIQQFYTQEIPLAEVEDIYFYELI